ncbi:phosphotransferase [Thalassotalea ponticola]|uniref:phosphotransferase n=1 Tax=Thalassotalea ponticola TaxID=1523392 RepID=UPI0025B2FB55|nr:phosphotransferase [Thalassotalea ponticola]MDN3651800.1 phosphotransferase [Thalassotalea ponticola]
MSNSSQALLQRYLQQQQLSQSQLLQSLWSGYGKIVRYYNSQDDVSVVAKQIQLPDTLNHPRGWSSNTSHQRKVTSYQVERDFYQYVAPLLSHCRLPRLLHSFGDMPDLVLVLEDLDQAGFNKRYVALDDNIPLSAIRLCLHWLAQLHGQGLLLTHSTTQSNNQALSHLWTTGCYWHLATRQDEFNSMAEQPLKRCAKRLDLALSNARFQTVVHGDAKIANFCFAQDDSAVAAVDFQYTGLGVGVRDVMYLFTSCLDQTALELHHQSLLDYYFDCLQRVIAATSIGLNGAELEAEWRSLYLVCWADFHRFLIGWSPDHYKINAFMQKMSEQALAEFT